MENQRSLHQLLQWSNTNTNNESMDQQTLLLTMELEDELKLRDRQIAQLKDLLQTALKERDLAHHNCHKAILDNLVLHQQFHHSAPTSAVTSIDDDPRCDDSIVSSPCQLPAADADLPLPLHRPLPDKGNLLQAVINAGPLLQTLLVTGTLPEWRNPPPPLDALRIPPPPVALRMVNCGRILTSNNRKRGFREVLELDSSPIPFKLPRLLQ